MKIPRSVKIYGWKVYYPQVDRHVYRAIGAEHSKNGRALAEAHRDDDVDGDAEVTKAVQCRLIPEREWKKIVAALRTIPK